MNSRQFIQTVKASLSCLRFEEVTDEFIDAIDALRNVHKKLQDELEYELIYPHHVSTIDAGLYQLIKDQCDEYGIKFIFKAKESSWYKKGNFVSYYYNDRNITDLVVFKKSDKNKPTRPINEIGFEDL